jgi:ABC transport system ATP-binding/permease protein
MNLISIENISKTYGDKTLFDGLNFGIDKGDKTALIASNGSGKTTLLRIISGKETTDSGSLVLRQGLRIGFLEQEPVFDHSLTIDQLIAGANSKIQSIIQSYNRALEAQTDHYDKDSQKALDLATAEMDLNKAWDYERRLKQILTLFKITKTGQQISLLSGGEKKRLALAMLLLDEPDVLILDEPTNHLDIEMIEWLEKHLSQANITLLMVTHDRYFLDRICTHIVEMGNKNLYHHNGNYEYYLEKKSEREESWDTETDKARQLMRKELDWIRRMPKARTTKSKSRIDSFEKTKDRANEKHDKQEINLQVNMSRIGGKILEVEHISKSYGDLKVVDDFSYLFKKGERVGIIGSNGSGKTSFLNLITAEQMPDSGQVIKGDTIIFGYYHQAGINLKEDKRVIEVVTEIAEMVPLGKNQKLSASQFLNYFMFPPETQYKYVSNLSGGERRRLYLLTVLIKNPNFLILDEPTNDLDLLVLNKLEEFLSEYKGCLIIVSHDRYFLDKLSDHMFVFEGQGKIRDFYGGYTKYRAKAEEEKRQKDLTKKSGSKPIKQTATASSKQKSKLTFKEKLEYEKLEGEIGKMEREKSELERALNESGEDYEKLTQIGKKLEELNQSIDEKSFRWMELDEFV